MVERPLHRTPTCLSGEWEGTLCRIAPLRAVVCSQELRSRVLRVRSRVVVQPHPSMWGEDAPPLAEGELGLASSRLGGIQVSASRAGPVQGRCKIGAGRVRRS